MFRAKGLLCAAALMAAPLSAKAATITPFEMAFFTFDTSGVGALQITGSAFACIFGDQCFQEDGLLAPGAQLQVDYGTTHGGAQLGSRYFTNNFPTPINNAAGKVATDPPIFIPAETDEVFATFRYVNDVYSVEEFRIFSADVELTGEVVPPDPIAAMPLAASGWMLLLGLCAIGVVGQQARKRRARGHGD